MTPSARVLPHRALLFNCIALTTLSGPVHLLHTHLRIYVLGRSTAALCCKCNTVWNWGSGYCIGIYSTVQDISVQHTVYKLVIMTVIAHSVSVWWHVMMWSEHSSWKAKSQLQILYYNLKVRLDLQLVSEEVIMKPVWDLYLVTWG